MKYIYTVIVLAVVSMLGMLFFSGNSHAANKNDFKPGNIISDAVFYNSTSMTPGQIQTFLNSKNPNCDYDGTKPASDWGYPGITHAKLAEYIRNGTNGFSRDTGFHAPPYKCLTRYEQTTPQMEAASMYCNAISAGTRTAAQIIHDVARACGINPQVLIVLLEKEQSLVTDSWPLNRQLRNATGFACPDTAPCDPRYEGFFYQVYYAARQFKVYQAHPNSYNYRAGQNNNIYWHPDLSRCGSSTVYIENQATAALYVYTPYRPNTAALNNLYGTGDSCSSYGNRNFWRIFTDWFGSTHYTVGGGIRVKYAALGGEASVGLPLTNEVRTANGGVYQQFERGRIYWKDGIGASYVFGGVGQKYASLDYDKSILGDPRGDEVVLDSGGVYQQFDRGRIYWKAGIGGGWVVFGGTGVKYIGLGADGGALGYPISDETVLTTGGVYQQYENGRIYWAPGLGGGWSVLSDVLESFISNGEESILGYPTSDLNTLASGASYQHFEKATISKTVSGIFVTRGGVGVKYNSSGGPKGNLGVAISNETLLPSGGVYQQFQSGRIYWKAGIGGGWIRSPEFLNFYTSNGADTGYIGYPLSDSRNLGNGNEYQIFEKATLHKTQNGIVSTHGGIGVRYNAMNGVQGHLGSPTGSETILSTGGVYQQFERGRIYWKAGLGGGHAVIGGIGVMYISLGADNGTLGYPKSGEIVTSSNGDTYQQFERGRIYWKPRVGASVKYS